MSKRRIDWVKMSKTNEVKSLECQEIGGCERCGETLWLHLPMGLETFAALLEAFAKAHFRCRERAPEPEVHIQIHQEKPDNGPQPDPH